MGVLETNPNKDKLFFNYGNIGKLNMFEITGSDLKSGKTVLEFEASQGFIKFLRCGEKFLYLIFSDGKIVLRPVSNLLTHENDISHYDVPKNFGGVKAFDVSPCENYLAVSYFTKTSADETSNKITVYNISEKTKLKKIGVEEISIERGNF